MHKSRLGAVIIDCHSADFAQDAEFWSQALGYSQQHSDKPEDKNYIKLETPPEEVGILLQKVEHPSRVHLDIETDDIEAEVARLEKLGARKLDKIKTWVVMEAPSGHRFCVVRPQRSDFERSAIPREQNEDK